VLEDELFTELEQELIVDRRKHITSPLGWIKEWLGQ
jgi:hypothetical protein